jgi:hypothetical protein
VAQACGVLSSEWENANMADEVGELVLQLTVGRRLA